MARRRADGSAYEEARDIDVRRPPGAASPPLLFIHGAFTRAARWESWLAYFGAAGFDCVAPSLPAHDPPDREALSRLTFQDYLEAMREVARGFDEAPIIIGHSMGGLLAQHLAATTPCAGLVLVSSSPPWRIVGTWRSMPHLWRYTLPVLTGRPIRVSDAVALNLVLHDLAPAEQADLLRHGTWESGRAYRTMLFGHAPLLRGQVRCPVLCISGGSDRILRPATGARLAAFYGADHVVFPRNGHSLVAGSLVEPVAGAVMEWIGRSVLRAEAQGSFRVGAIV